MFERNTTKSNYTLSELLDIVAGHIDIQGASGSIYIGDEDFDNAYIIFMWSCLAMISKLAHKEGIPEDIVSDMMSKFHEIVSNSIKVYTDVDLSDLFTLDAKE